MANESRVSELIVRLRDEVSSGAKSATSSLKSLERGLGTLASTVGIGLGVGGLIAFSKSIIDSAGHLQDLSEQTGISAQALSGMQSLLEQSGTSVDAFAKGIFNAQKNLGNATPEVASAIQKLGLNLNDLLKSSPEEFLRKLAGALGQISDPITRNTLGAQVLGKAFKELSPALSEIADKFDELKAKGIKDEDIKRLDAFGDALTRIKNSAQISSAGKAADVANFVEFLSGTQDIEGRHRSIRDLLEVVRALRESTGKFIGGKVLGLDALIEDMTKERDSLTNIIELRKNAAAEATKEARAQKDITEAIKLSKSSLDFIKDLTERGGVAGAPFRESLDKIKQQFLDPNFFDFSGISTQLTEVKTKIIDTFGTSIFDKAPGLLKDIDEFQSRLKQFQEFKGIEITADGSQAVREAQKVKSALQGIPGASFGSGSSQADNIIGFGPGGPIFSTANLSERLRNMVLNPNVFKANLDFTPTVSESPAVPFSQWLNEIAPGKIQDFVDEVEGTKLNFNTDFSQAIINTLDAIAGARQELALTRTVQGADPRLTDPLTAMLQTKEREGERILGILMSLANRNAAPAAADGGGRGGGGDNIFNFYFNGPITREIVDRDLLPKFERTVQMATGKTVTFRVLN